MILSGELHPGSRLPPSRQLAKREKVGRVTIMQAYEQLQVEGFVISRRGAGTFVADDIIELQSEPSQPSFIPPLSDWGRRVVAHGLSSSKVKARPEIDFGFGRSFSQLFPYDVFHIVGYKVLK